MIKINAVEYNLLRHEATAIHIRHGVQEDLIGKNIIYVASILHNINDNCDWCNALRVRIASRTPLYNK